MKSMKGLRTYTLGMNYILKNTAGCTRENIIQIKRSTRIAGEMTAAIIKRNISIDLNKG